MSDNQEIKVGSKVAIVGRYGISIQTVSGETPTCWKVAGALFYKKNGHKRTSDQWDTTSIRLATQFDYDEVEKSNLVGVLKRTQFTQLPLATLRKIKELLAKGE